MQVFLYDAINDGPTISVNLTDKQAELLRSIRDWPSKFPMHTTELDSGERQRVDRLRCLGLIRPRVLRLTEKGSAVLSKLEHQ